MRAKRVMPSKNSIAAFVDPFAVASILPTISETAVETVC
jgi:hypothetical protein